MRSQRRCAQTSVTLLPFLERGLTTMFTRRSYAATFGVVALFGAAMAYIPILAQTARSPVAPREEQLKAAVNEAYARFKDDTSGKNADYIPYLAHVDSKLFGVSVVTTD